MTFQRLHRYIAASLAGGALGGIALSASPAAANVEFGATAGPHTFSVNNELGVEDTDDATSLRNSVLFGLRLGFTFNDMLGIEGELGVIPSEGRNLVFDVWTLTYRAHLIAQFRAADPNNKLIPFVTVGAGAITVTSSDNTTEIYEDTDELFYAGLGFKYRVENGWGLRFDARAIAVPTSKLDGMDSATGPALDSEFLLSVYKEFGRAAPTRPIDDDIDDMPPRVADADGDGIPDDIDQCVNEPEDFDGFEDEDGCPDLDNDNDGIPDTADRCKDEPEDLDGFQDDDGCPDPDNDGDGLMDAEDGCPNEAEDMDGFQDEDGCPDLDNDGDGVPDAQDQCGIDHPKMMETWNGFEDDDGCADVVPKAVQKFTGVIQGITFKTDSDEILKPSFKKLEPAVKVLNDYPGLKLEIQGHTDDQGDRDHNVDLSQRRAEAVRQYFIGKGISEDRLVARGYGPDAPLVNKKTKAARAKNRRVEFKLISDTGAGAGADPME
jgi:outer membrane protein OmpA-like peptidoglycan-associated protein/outer membrane protein W